MSCWKTTKNMEKNNHLPTIPCGSMLMYPTSVPLIGPLPFPPLFPYMYIPWSVLLSPLAHWPHCAAVPHPFTLLAVTLGPIFAPPPSPQPIGPDALLHPPFPIFKPGSSIVPSLCPWTLVLCLEQRTNLPCGTPCKVPFYLSMVLMHSVFLFCLGVQLLILY